MATKILFFDTNALIKYFVPEIGSDIIKWLCHPEIKIGKSLRFLVNEQVCNEFEDKIQIIYESGRISKSRYESVLRQFHLSYKGKYFKIVGEKTISNTKMEISFSEAITKLNLVEGKNDWDARIYLSLANALAHYARESHPILVSSDAKFNKKIINKSFRVINPEKHTRTEILTLLT